MVITMAIPLFVPPGPQILLLLLLVHISLLCRLSYISAYLDEATPAKTRHRVRRQHRGGGESWETLKISCGWPDFIITSVVDRCIYVYWSRKKRDL